MKSNDDRKFRKNNKSFTQQVQILKYPQAKNPMKKTINIEKQKTYNIAKKINIDNYTETTKQIALGSIENKRKYMHKATSIFKKPQK